jgi:flotillin
MERETDQEIKDRQNAELEQERTERAERLGHDIRREDKRTEEVRMEEGTRQSDGTMSDPAEAAAEATQSQADADTAQAQADADAARARGEAEAEAARAQAEADAQKAQVPSTPNDQS